MTTHAAEPNSGRHKLLLQTVATAGSDPVGGPGNVTAGTLAEPLPISIKRVGLSDVFGESAPNAALLGKHDITGDHVAAAGRSLLAT